MGHKTAWMEVHSHDLQQEKSPELLEWKLKKKMITYNTQTAKAINVYKSTNTYNFIF
jgi:hypothetical protein